MSVELIPRHVLQNSFSVANWAALKVNLRTVVLLVLCEGVGLSSLVSSLILSLPLALEMI